MASTATATPMEIDEFINGALVSWLESCLPRAELLAGYTSLLDGHIIHSVWLQIDPEPQNNPSELNDLNGKSLSIARAKNFECIVRNLKSLFEEELGQTILVLPDAFTLGHHPETRNGLDQMKTLLTLLLGAAVQCPNKELFIARIKELDLETQHAIVALIKQVTDSHSLVLTEDSLERLTPQSMYTHILRLTKERDLMYLKWIDLACVETEMAVSDNLVECGQGVGVPRSPSNGTATSTPSSSSNSESNHLAVECADLRSKNRKLRQELEEKSENLLELREELDDKKARFDKLRQESQEWFTEAKRASAYRDEVDILRERAERADRLEIEVQKYREKLGDSDFYKSRVEELREDNRVLLESKEMLEEQLQRYRKRSEHAISLESEIIKYKQKLNDMALERDVDRSKLEELLEENAQLQLVARNLNSTMDLDKSFSENEDDCNSGDNSLSEQLTNNAQTRALKLELENRRLTAALEQLKESSFHESTSKLLELEKEKKKLSLKTEQMQENIQRLTQQNVELEGVFKNALEENKKLQDAVDSRQKSYDRQSLEREADRQKLSDAEQHVETLNKEKQRIQTLNDSIQRRADDLERLAESKAKELEQYAEKSKQYEQTKQKLYEIEAKVSTFERENASLLKEVSKLKEGSEQKSVQLDESINRLEAQSKELQKLGKALEDSEQVHQKFVELEKQNQELASQRIIDQEMISTLRNDLVTGTLVTKKVRHNLEKLGLADEEPGELNVEHVVEKLVRNPETFKTVREIMLNVTREQQAEEEEREGGVKSDMCVLCHRQEIFTVEKNIELAALEPLPPAPTQPSSQELRFEHKLRVSPARESAELNRIKDSNTQLQTENARLSVDVAALGSQITSLNTQHVALQLANSQLAAEKDTLLKDIDSLQQEHKHALQDQVTLQCLHDQLSAEYESLNKDKEQLKAAVRDLRQELRDTREQQTALEQRIEELTTQNNNMKTCSEDLSILRTEHSKLTDDFRNLFATSDRFKNEYKNIQEQYKMVRMEHSSLKLQNTELSGELNTKSDQVRHLQVEYSKVQQRCEMLIQNNADLDSERKALMDNVSQLLSQYQELLAISLEDKKHFHEEEKNYTERVHSLKRQKEKLEEKIMEHYKKSETTVHKKKPFASMLVRRVKKASSDLMNKVPSRNRRSWVDDARTNSQFVIGSESGGNESDNSNEEPLSIASDTHLLQRNVPLRQSLQRSLEAPDVTGSSLTLGTAGSRRTVYLIDEHQKLPDGSSPGSAQNQQSGGSSGSGNAATPTPAEPQTPQKTADSSAPTGPATFLMYNRINTTIGGASNSGDQSPLLQASGSVSGGTPLPDDKSARKRPEDKSNSIWYEYGCV
ncbi:girdin isoform X3 [Drosophila takahashii]|uniref:girdin isoform X3 n=1 Tax=Drosophila takahashii TaxID=29030 RepID=UPI001CF83C84|nr:girdin isoform X3 [Drosophila takahashii]